ncbi:Alpha/Beta hydrolase protein [Rhodocollybia butyracea]|uniref:Alpha/Beta hydrolase protein n=1 Tax=Rhodocollybia butyracea TaxID=206335 RepID=A0A9P5PYI0_9AGAR|nr:Alpha/Beta hydrolase protein [Rhodocollybia butyracea]
MFLWPFSWPKSVPLPSEETHLHDNPQSLASILLHYTTPGVAPPSARSDPKLKPQARRPVRLLDLWKYGVIAVVKATEVVGAILVHNIYGPKKRSWGIEMTIINTIMRGANRHSALVDIGTIRMAMGLAGLVPLPSDALVTPVTFNVRKRNLRGILAEFDAQETGRRELSGEWVIGRHTWLRLQDEWKNSKGSKTREHRKKKERVILYIHGGAYYASSSIAQRIISIPLAKYTDARVFALDYRLAPECKFPCSLHDAVSGYFRLTVDLHIPPSSIVIAGDSAGGALSIALLMYLRDNHYELPAAAILMSPWVDLTMSCESWDSNEPYDVIPMLPPDSHLNPIQLYLGDNMEQYMTHPYASPLFGNFEGLPPMLIQSGDSEVLRDEITLLAHKATLAGVEVRHELYEDAIHVFQLYPFLEATTKSFVSMRDFVRKFLAQIELEEPQEQLNEEAEKGIEDEIESESVIMVGGDGLKTASGMAGVKLSVALQGAAFADSSSDTEEEGTHIRKEFSSWGPRSWGFSIRPSSPDSTPTSSTRRRAGTLPSSPVLAGTYPASLSPRPTTPRTKSQSHITQRAHLAPSLSSRRSGLPPRINIMNNNSNNFRKSESLREPIRNRSPSATSPSSPKDGILPSPSIRRSSRANSHQDLSSLVDQWNNQGPANRTVIYPLSRS